MDLLQPSRSKLRSFRPVLFAMLLNLVLLGTSCGQTAKTVSSASRSCTVRVRSLVTHRWISTPFEVTVGQKIGLDALAACGSQRAVPPGDPVWNVEGNPIHSYALDGRNPAPLLPAEYRKSTLNLYWVEPGVRKVQITGRVGDRRIHAVVMAHVVAPRASTRSVSCRVDLWHVPNQVNYPVRVYVSFGVNNVCPNQPGMTIYWQADQQNTVSDGRIAIVQLISDTVTHNNRVCEAIKQPELDDSLFYPILGKEDSIGLNKITRATTIDSPSYALGGVGSYKGSFALTTYLMFKPVGRDSIWVPLAAVQWGFNSAANYLTGGGWVLDAGRIYKPKLILNPSPPLWLAIRHQLVLPTNQLC